jgi:hypothetical protein
MIRTIIAVGVAFAASIALLAGLGIGTHHTAPKPCTFDGGGTIASGDAATTTEGTTWVCADGTLIRI